MPPNGNGGSWQSFWNKLSVPAIGFLIFAVVMLYTYGQDRRFEIGGVIDAVAQEKIKENGKAIEELKKEKADEQDMVAAIAKVETKVDKLDDKFDKLKDTIIGWKNSK